jgi:alkylation response protein AidB-like acyl-CoA dehydrogenase
MADELEARFGPAMDPDNPLGDRAVVAADERGEMLAAGERMLEDYTLNAEFVPRSLGGRLAQADRLALTGRTIFRRDPVLALGYGMSSLIGSVPIWTCGSPAQQRWVADLLLGNRRIAAGYTELAHGGDFTRASLRARRSGDGYTLCGGKQLISNAVRAQAITLFARTDDAPGSRSHSHLLVDTTSLPADRIQHSRFHTSGMRALRLGGVEFLDCPVPGDSVVGTVGGALEAVLKAFQVTRTVLPGMAIGILDSQLRLATRFAVERILYGRPIADLPRVRSILVGAFLDLLIGDCLAMVAARALHVLPAQASVYAAAVKYFVPQLMHDANYSLSTLLGAHSYLREGTYAAFQKNTRDLSVAMLSHASSATCQASIIPQLSQLAARSWLSAVPPQARLFRVGEALPELDFTALVLSAKGEENLSATILAARDEPALAGLSDLFVAQFADLARHCATLPPRERTVLAGPATFDLVDKYATMLAASACIGVWMYNDRQEPAWLVAALRRLAQRLGVDPDPARDGIEQQVFADLWARYDEVRGFDLVGALLAH